MSWQEKLQDKAARLIKADHKLQEARRVYLAAMPEDKRTAYDRLVQASKELQEARQHAVFH